MSFLEKNNAWHSLFYTTKKDPDFGDMAGLAEPMLKAFPEIIESTTKVEIGLNFVK